MSWSYSGNPSHSAKDAVRFLIGDTDETEKLLTDEEINYFLSFFNNVALNASIRCCETIIAKSSRLVDETAGSVSLSFSQRAAQFRSLLADLRTRLATDDMTPIAGGISKSDKQRVAQNADRVPPDFSKHQNENNQIAPWVTVPQTNTLNDPNENN